MSQRKENLWRSQVCPGEGWCEHRGIFSSTHRIGVPNGWPAVPRHRAPPKADCSSAHSPNMPTSTHVHLDIWCYMAYATQDSQLSDSDLCTWHKTSPQDWAIATHLVLLQSCALKIWAVQRSEVPFNTIMYYVPNGEAGEAQDSSLLFTYAAQDQTY
jgi:hypothetical protein